MEFPPNTLVPVKKRLEVYEKTLSIISDIEHDWHTEGLCLLLPMVLWNLDSYLDRPDGEDWNYHATPNMFPEIAKHLDSLVTLWGNKKIMKRREILSEIIAELNKETKS